MKQVTVVLADGSSVRHDVDVNNTTLFEFKQLINLTTNEQKLLLNDKELAWDVGSLWLNGIRDGATLKVVKKTTQEMYLEKPITFTVDVQGKEHKLTQYCPKDIISSVLIGDLKVHGDIDLYLNGKLLIHTQELHHYGIAEGSKLTSAPMGKVIVSFNGKPTDVTVPNFHNEFVKELKNKIEWQLNVYPDEQILSFDGAVLKDTQRLGDCVINGAQLVLRKKIEVVIAIGAFSNKVYCPPEATIADLKAELKKKYSNHYSKHDIKLTQNGVELLDDRTLESYKIVDKARVDGETTRVAQPGERIEQVGGMIIIHQDNPPRTLVRTEPEPEPEPETKPETTPKIEANNTTKLTLWIRTPHGGAFMIDCTLENTVNELKAKIIAHRCFSEDYASYVIEALKYNENTLQGTDTLSAIGIKGLEEIKFTVIEKQKAVTTTTLDLDSLPDKKSQIQSQLPLIVGAISAIACYFSTTYIKPISLPPAISIPASIVTGLFTMYLANSYQKGSNEIS